MGGLFRGKNSNRAIVSNVASSVTYVTDSCGAKSGAMSPSAAKVALGRKTSGLRVSWGSSVAMGADVEGAVFAIVTCTMAPKAFGEGGSGATGDWDIKEVSGGREDRTIIAELYHERAVRIDSVFI